MPDMALFALICDVICDAVFVLQVMPEAVASNRSCSEPTNGAIGHASISGEPSLEILGYKCEVKFDDVVRPLRKMPSL
jgi:hypothetical protein